MLLLRFIAGLIGLIVVSCPAFAQGDHEKPIIRWYYQSFPPLHITDGPQAGQGFADKALAYLHAQLPGYNHLKVYSSLSRMHGELKARENACHLGLFKTAEREAYAYFSEPVIEILPNRLLMLKKTAPRFLRYLNAAGEVDLEKLFAANGLMYGVEVNRVYSPRINAYIDKQTKADGKVELPNPRFAALMLHGRINYGFAFAFEATYRFQMLGRADAFTTLPIAGEPDMLLNNVGCSKSEFGAGVIAEVNRVAPALKLAHRRFYEEWLDDRAVDDFHAALKARGELDKTAEN
ncbi:TIGR02285 family protein [Kordiimonas aestuarii]|uniref:TIGR02285 family protein n=1 Tax=Kordiimonas aestuarii TaxID=1005925 RepID=UPI0021CE93B2|nr:TIGR02285 family protein [Kordiimonas aestuarii]